MDFYPRSSTAKFQITTGCYVGTSEQDFTACGRRDEASGGQEIANHEVS